MNSCVVETLETNEAVIRYRIFSGEIPVDCAAAEIYRMSMLQCAADIDRVAKRLRRDAARIAANAGSK